MTDTNSEVKGIEPIDLNDLPQKDSALLRLAATCLREVLARPGFKFDLSKFIAVDGAGICHLCGAGAIYVVATGYDPTAGDPVSREHDRLAYLAMRLAFREPTTEKLWATYWGDISAIPSDGADGFDAAAAYLEEKGL